MISQFFRSTTTVRQLVCIIPSAGTVATSLVAHTGKALLKTIATRLGAYCDWKELLPGEQCGFRPHCSTTDIMFPVCRLQELGTKRTCSCSYVSSTCRRHTTLCRSRTSLAGARSLRSTPPQMFEVIHQVNDGMMRACQRNDDGRSSEWFEVAQGLRQGCMFSSLLFNVFSSSH